MPDEPFNDQGSAQMIKYPHGNGVNIYDCTIREAEMIPGIHFSDEDTFFIARQLHIVTVDCIEAGFPIVPESERIFI